MTEIFTTLRELTDTERLNARERAQGVLLRTIGEKPKREQFAGMAVSEYPKWVTGWVATLMFVVFAAAAMPSLFRLYEAGFTYHLSGIDNVHQARIVGIATFLLAEFLIITSTLAASIFYRSWRRAMFVFPIALGLAVAFVGNWTVVRPSDVFAWLETLVPPLAVLFMSLVGERLMLDAVKQQHADEKAYTEAVAHWQQQTRSIEDHPRWQVTYGRSLMEELRKANSKGTGAKARREFMNQMNRGQWAALVRREMTIEGGEWLTEATAPNVSETTPQAREDAIERRPFGSIPADQGEPVSILRTPNGNGHTASAVN
jgi:hypothetical protein